MHLRSGKVVSKKAIKNNCVISEENTIHYNDGSYYIGGIVNGKPQGKGTMYYNDGSILQVNSWRNGRAYGFGNRYFGNNKTYIGMFKDGHRFGWGTLICDDKVTRGNWKNSGLDGYGFRQFVNVSGKTSFCIGKFKERNSATCLTYVPDNKEAYLTYWKKGHYDEVRTVINEEVIKTLDKCFEKRRNIKETEIINIMKNEICPKLNIPI